MGEMVIRVILVEIEGRGTYQRNATQLMNRMVCSGGKTYNNIVPNEILPP
jgi:hypothetical protein